MRSLEHSPMEADHFYSLLPDLENVLSHAMKNCHLYDPRTLEKSVFQANSIIDQYLGYMARRFHRYAWFDFPETTYHRRRYGFATLSSREPIQETVINTSYLHQLNQLITDIDRLSLNKRYYSENPSDDHELDALFRDIGNVPSVTISYEQHGLLPRGFPGSLSYGMLHTGHSTQLAPNELLLIFSSRREPIINHCHLFLLKEFSPRYIRSLLVSNLLKGIDAALALYPETYQQQIDSVGKFLTSIEMEL